MKRVHDHSDSEPDMDANLESDHSALESFISGVLPENEWLNLPDLMRQVGALRFVSACVWVEFKFAHNS